MDYQSFLKNHADTIVIIGFNIAIFAILVSICISTSHRIDSSNARTDFLSTQIIELMREIKK